MAIQHIKLENEGWERDLTVQEPKEPSFTGALIRSSGMRSFDAVSVMDLWERGRELGPLWRAAMLAAAATGDSEASAAEWPLGKREAALLQLRTACFGRAMPVSVACPACGERLRVRNRRGQRAD